MALNVLDLSTRKPYRYSCCIFRLMTANMECPQCHSSNPPTADSCVQCGASFGFDGATLAISASPVTAPVVSTTQGIAKGWSMPSATAVISTAPLAPGTVLGTRYEIIQMLGHGGMGAVYKARDCELDRVVALKVIRPELAMNPEILARFKQELILARQITHRNVIRIFDLGEANGTKFITMEFIEGQDLKSLVTEKGKLSSDETVRIIEQVCLALEAAHYEGVVHRDLKPQNIMIDKQGKAAVMDFGIARSVESGSATQTGMLMGTPDYMSPEQVVGDRVDARSDLFTLGVILYELLIGAVPYRAETVQAAMFKRTRERPRPPLEVDATVPRFLSDVTTKCLEIKPTQRYQSAREILQDLEAWRGGAKRGSASSVFPWLRNLSVPQIRWILAGAAALILVVAGVALRGRFASSQQQQATAAPAVSLAILPFRNASGDQGLDWLGSSVAETLSTDVGQSSHLRIVSPERVSQILRDLQFSADTSFDPPTVRRLADYSNADNIVWGQYARFGNQIRIDATVQDIKRGQTTKLSESASETEILSGIDRLANDVRSNLALSSSVVKELQGQSFKPSTSSVPALRDYNQGLQLARGGNYLDATKQFEASTKEDPSFALAYSQLGQTYAQLGQDNDAEEASRRAVELSDNLPSREKYLIQASHYKILRDGPKAIEAYENLAKGSPNDADVLFNLGALYENSSAYDKAREEDTKVLALDPKRVEGLLAMGKVEIEGGDPQSGLEYLTRGQAMAIESANDEERSEILQAMGGAYAALGKQEDAIRNYQDSLDIKRKLGLKKGIADSLQAIASADADLGRPDPALKNYNDALKIRLELGDKAGTGDVLSDLGQLSDDRGQYDEALKFFKQSLQAETDAGSQSNQALVLNNIGNTYLFKADYQNARTYFEQALQLREALKVPSDIADTLHNLGETSGKMGQYDQSLAFYLRALDIRRSGGDKRAAALESSGMGVQFGYQGRYGAALSSQEDAVKTLREIKEQGFWLAEILGFYGQALSQVGRFDDAQKALDEALAAARELKNQAKIAELQSYQGDNLFYRGDYKAAAAIYDQAVQSATHTSDANLILISKLNAAKSAVKLGRFLAAAASLRNPSKDADGMGLKYVSVECSIYLGEALIGMKSYDLARKQLATALSQSEKLGSRGLLAESHYLLARDLELSGKASEAQAHYEQARAIADEIQKESHTDTIMKRSDLGPIYLHPAG